MKILLYGELYPNVVHGVSIANRLNLNVIESSSSVDVIEENTSLSSIGSVSFVKISSYIFSLLKVILLCRVRRHDVLYTNLALSPFGLIKTVLLVFSFTFLRRSRVILHLHRGDFAKIYTDSWACRSLIKICFRRIDLLLVLSQNQKLEMKTYLPDCKLYVVENSVLDEQLYIKSAFNTSTMVSGFLYMSNYLQEKGIFEILEAFTSEKTLSIECYGEFGSGKLEIERVKPKNVTLNPVVTGNEKYRLIRQAEALILPTWNEGQPIIILEAMMMGVIVLTTKVGLIGELLGEDYPFFFEPKNAESLVRCIRKFKGYTNKETLKRRLMVRYAQFYSNEIHRQKLTSAFEFDINKI